MSQFRHAISKHEIRNKFKARMSKKTDKPRKKIRPTPEKYVIGRSSSSDRRSIDPPAKKYVDRLPATPEKNMPIDRSNPGEKICRSRPCAEAGGGHPRDNDRLRLSRRRSDVIIAPCTDPWSLWSEGGTAPFYKGVLTPERDWSAMGVTGARARRRSAHSSRAPQGARVD